MSEQRTTKLSEAIEEAAENGKRRLSYFSFGDDGLTATVGASGSLLRITQHFPGERTGFCVDVPGLPDPSYVEERLKSFLRSSRLIRPRHVIGPNIDSLCRRRSFRLHANDSMTNDRWPTFDRELLNGDDLTLQYVASKGTIYQIFEMSGGDDKLPPLKVTPDLLIRDLDFVDEDNQFNKAEAGNKVVYYHESRGNCLIRVHENSHKKAILYIQALNEEMPLEFIRDESTSPTSETPLGRFVNTKPYFGQSHKQRPTEEGPDSEEVTTKESAARKLSASWSSYRVHRKSAPKLKYKLRQERPKYIIILSYTLEYVPKHEEPIIPSMSWSSILETKDQLLMPWKPYNISEDQTVDFFLKRNLEHILSVCSIPVRRTIGEWRPAVALTCGDVDSHRVAAGASL